MSEFKIRTIQDMAEEPVPTIIGVDKFDDIDTNDAVVSGDHYQYYCGIVVQNYGGEEVTNSSLCFGSQSSFNNGGMDIHIDDKFGLPTPSMYRLLGEALKKKGMVFNKKKGRFEVRKKGEE